MACEVFRDFTVSNIKETKLLIVGAGGIGCELLKNVVLTGFEDIHIVDLDTIDLSNLNRQFLFHKQHIGKPKAIVAKESVLKFNPKAKIVADHDSITSPKYNVEFYRQFTCVANALDNVAARSHVNRMCMAADIPLIESGSAGFLGQTTVYKRRVSECFECLPRKPQKTYPGCTIRNTPSEPVHCVVWSKHLFNQLFGESDAEDEVSPDVHGRNFLMPDTRLTTREWARAKNNDPLMIFKKLFNEDISYLRRMTDLWRKRKAPILLDFDKLPDAVPGSSQSTESEIRDFRKWSMKECGEIFIRSLKTLYERLEEEGSDGLLVWDKDDDVCLDFVAACSNLRAFVFHIEQSNRFEIKAIAGNIIPAIASTNAIVGGLIVLQILKVLKGDFTFCRTSWINGTYSGANKLISACQLEKPNPLCLVCSTASNEVTVKVNLKQFLLKTLEEKLLKEKLLMVQPDVVINDGSGTILLSSDPDDMTDEMYNQPLTYFNVDSDGRLLCEDFLQNFKIHMTVVHDKDLNDQDFIIDSNVENIKPEEKPEANDDDVDDDNSDTTDVNLEEEPELIMLPTVDDEKNGVEPPTKKIKTGSH